MHERGIMVRVLMAGALVALLDMLYPMVMYTKVLAHIPAMPSGRSRSV